MVKPHRYGAALSAVALASVISGCALPGSTSPRTAAANSKAGSTVGLALQAQAALDKGDFATAVNLAEQIVASRPSEPMLRTLLGNAYFGAGRFASAEAAYKDSLSLVSNQPQVILKLVLATIAQGRSNEALAFLAAAQEVLDPADYGLALALAGEPSHGVAVLERAARAQGADARVRQNLALAYALTGEWESARTVAAQDVPANLLDSRIQEWMALARPTRPSDQVAALVGVTPAASDPGQPVALALRRADGTRLASAAPAVQPAPAPVAVAQPPVQLAEVAPPPQPYYAPVEAPAPEAEYVPPVPQSKPAIAPRAERKPTAPVRAAAFVPKPAAKAPVRALGRSNALVQLGAYSSRERVSVAWNQITKRYPTLRSYSPVTARFDGPRGTVYRLSVKGFASEQEAISRCRLLRTKGGSCFVRSVAGDAPVRLASR